MRKVTRYEYEKLMTPDVSENALKERVSELSKYFYMSCTGRQVVIIGGKYRQAIFN